MEFSQQSWQVPELWGTCAVDRSKNVWNCHRFTGLWIVCTCDHGHACYMAPCPMVPYMYISDTKGNAILIVSRQHTLIDESWWSTLTLKWGTVSITRDRGHKPPRSNTE